MIFNRVGGEQEINIYASDITIDAIKTIANLVLDSKQSAYLDNNIHLNVVHDRQKVTILGEEFTFYDVYAKKVKQFGFRLDTRDGKVLVCNGDETLNEKNYDLVSHADFFIHECFCLDSEKESKKPYEKGHCTSKDVCLWASQLKVKNLILYHIKDEDVATRKKRYLEENEKFFSGNLYVPNDLEMIDIS